MRNSSPKPSSFLSSRPETASYVVSRDVTPVPPVVMITCTSGLSSWAAMAARTSSGSSRTIRWPVTWWFSAQRRSQMARPLVSVASVRVSLIVRM